MATYAIGDIQGCLREFDGLLEKINFSSDDELWLAGDLINRGPQSLQLLRRVKALSSQCQIVLGNHDLHFLAILFGGHKASGKDTFEELLQAPDVYEIGHWLREQKLVHHDQDHILVHAGIPGFWASTQAFAYAEEVEAVIGQREGITLSAGNISFSNNEASIKVKANTIGDNGQVETKEARNWGLYADHNGLGDLKVGDTIDLQGKSFTIAGWNSRARKSPISITDANGRGYKCSVEMVKMYNRNLVA